MEINKENLNNLIKDCVSFHEVYAILIRYYMYDSPEPYKPTLRENHTLKELHIYVKNFEMYQRMLSDVIYINNLNHRINESIDELMAYNIKKYCGCSHEIYEKSCLEGGSILEIYEKINNYNYEKR